MRRSNLVLASAAALAVTPCLALAADPGEGKVSNAAPKVTWAGETTGGFITTFGQIFVNISGQQQPCEAPSCDEFALEVADAGDLTVAVTAETSTISYLQVVKPDGSAVFADGIDPEGKPDNTTLLKIKKAPAGAYKIQTAQNNLQIDAYTAYAQLGSPAAPAAPVGAPPATTPTQPGPQQQPSQQAAEPRAAAVLALKAGKLSAKRLNKARRAAVTVSTSSPVTDVQAALARSGKVLGTAKLAKLDGTGKLTLRLKRKLKPGTYQLVVKARDGASTVGAQVNVKIGR